MKNKQFGNSLRSLTNLIQLSFVKIRVWINGGKLLYTSTDQNNRVLFKIHVIDCYTSSFQTVKKGNLHPQLIYSKVFCLEGGDLVPECLYLHLSCTRNFILFLSSLSEDKYG